MARRSNSNAESTPVETVEETVEVTPEETVEVTPEETVEVTPEVKPEKPVEVEADLTDFKAAAEVAVGEADETTGDLPKTAIDSVNKVYREIDGIKGKNAARNWLDEMMKDAISERKDIGRARAFVDLKDDLTAGKSGTSTPRTPADPTAAFVQKATILQLAYSELVSNVPEGVSDTWSADADKAVADLTADMDTYRTYLASDDEDAEVPEVSPVVRQAFRLATGKASGGGASRATLSGPRRDTATHIAQAFADLEVGAFLKVNEISKAASAEYGDDRPSAGAISARLFPKGREGYVGETVKAVVIGTDRGAVKTA